MLNHLLIWAAVILGIYLIKCGLNYFIQYKGHVLGVRIQGDMRRDMFPHLQKFPFAFFDENKTGYRKFRPVKKEKAKAEVNVIKIEKAVITTEVIPLKVLSEKIGITAAEITKRLFKEGIMKTINDSIDFDTAAFIASDLGIELVELLNILKSRIPYTLCNNACPICYG